MEHQLKDRRIETNSKVDNGASTKQSMNSTQKSESIEDKFKMNEWYTN